MIFISIIEYVQQAVRIKDEPYRNGNNIHSCRTRTHVYLLKRKIKMVAHLCELLYAPHNLYSQINNFKTVYNTALIILVQLFYVTVIKS